MRTTLIIFALLLLVPHNAMAGLGTGLVGYWPLDTRDTPWSSATAATTLDRSGNNSTGTLTSMSRSTSPVVGKLGQGLKFDGTSSYISVSGNPTTAIDNWTLAAWVNPATIPQRVVSNYPGMVVYNGNDIGGYGFGVGAADSSGSNFMGLYGSVVWLDSGYTFPSANKWYYLVMKRSAGTVSFYVNGAQTANTYTNTPNAVQTGFTIGFEVSTPRDSYFNGPIDDVRIYNRALSAGEVQQLYRQGLAMDRGGFFSFLIKMFSFF